MLECHEVGRRMLQKGSTFSMRWRFGCKTQAGGAAEDEVQCERSRVSEWAFVSGESTPARMGDSLLARMGATASREAGGERWQNVAPDGKSRRSRRLPRFQFCVASQETRHQRKRWNAVTPSQRPRCLHYKLFQCTLFITPPPNPRQYNHITRFHT